MCSSEGSFPEFVLSCPHMDLGDGTPVTSLCNMFLCQQSQLLQWTLNSSLFKCVSLCVWVLICTQEDNCLSRSVTGSLVTLSSHKLSSNTEKPLIVKYYWTFKLCGLAHTANLSTLDDRHCDNEPRVGYTHNKVWTCLGYTERSCHSHNQCSFTFSKTNQEGCCVEGWES